MRHPAISALVSMPTLIWASAIKAQGSPKPPSPLLLIDSDEVKFSQGSTHAVCREPCTNDGSLNFWRRPVDNHIRN